MRPTRSRRLPTGWRARQPLQGGRRNARAAGELPRCRLPAGRLDGGQPGAGAGGRGPRVARRPGERRSRRPACGTCRRRACGCCAVRRRCFGRTRWAIGRPTARIWRPRSIQLRSVARGRYREDVVAILGAPDDAAAIELGRQLLNRRTIAATIGATGRVIAAAAAADARPVWARALGRRLPPTTRYRPADPRNRIGDVDDVRLSVPVARWLCATACAPASASHWPS